MWPQAYDVFISHWRLCLELSCYLLLELLRKRQLLRTMSSQSELLARAEQRHISEHNETIRTMSTAFASEEQPTLDDLLSSAERDWSLRSSEPPSTKTPREQSYNRLARSSVPPPPPARKK